MYRRLGSNLPTWSRSALVASAGKAMAQGSGLTMASAAALVSCEHKRHIVGSVNTKFKLIGRDQRRIRLAEDTSDASVAVRQTGPIKVKESFKNGEDAFSEKRSVLFKRLHVSRFWDASHQSFVYVAWTDRLIDSSPRNSRQRPPGRLRRRPVRGSNAPALPLVDEFPMPAF